MQRDNCEPVGIPDGARHFVLIVSKLASSLISVVSCFTLSSFHPVRLFFSPLLLPGFDKKMNRGCSSTGMHSRGRTASVVQLLDNQDDDRQNRNVEQPEASTSSIGGKNNNWGTTGGNIVRERPIYFVDKTTESFEDAMSRCTSPENMFVVLNEKLKTFDRYRIGDPRLYSSLCDAAQFIQVFCDDKNRAASQNMLKDNGVVASLVESLVAIFESHLEDQVSPLRYEKLTKCWSQICSALWNCVDNPTNERNQKFVFGKLLYKLDKIMEFVENSAQSFEIQTEAYVVTIIQLLKALIVDNSTTLEILSSRTGLVDCLLESFRLRLEMNRLDPVMWKSVDLMAWVLSLIFQYENDALIKKGSTTDDSFMEKLKIDCKLSSLVEPCCSFLDKTEDMENPQSIGTILFLASIFSRNLDNVLQFNNCKGSQVILKIQGASHHPAPVKQSLGLLMNILTCQSKQLRTVAKEYEFQRPSPINDEFICPYDEITPPQSIQANNFPSKHGINRMSTPSRLPQEQVSLKSNRSYIGPSRPRRFSPIFTNSFSRNSPSKFSDTQSRISRYRTPSTFTGIVTQRSNFDTESSSGRPARNDVATSIRGSQSRHRHELPSHINTIPRAFVEPHQHKKSNGTMANEISALGLVDMIRGDGSKKSREPMPQSVSNGKKASSRNHSKEGTFFTNVLNWLFK
ncbi:uncharacterized protein LOC118436292 isoform X2 [Folsomia candida]|uniref:uncharacterized protein LOC118436292 isoform X2 n=1 Tax=Folsomia candida TaxID=158441 RepID=UPI001605044C|nr:uncharacterized protein LOC118436292 isoform X2 [Folsomia candida]